MKWQRKYRLTIEIPGQQQIVIQPPFTIRFNVNRDASATVNTMDIDIYNLSLPTRQNIFQDPFYQDPSLRKTIKLEAGYESPFSTIFTGTIFGANSARRGADIITSIHSSDGGWEVVNGFIWETFNNAKKSRFDLLTYLASKFSPNLQVGSVSGSFKDNILQRPVVLSGNIYSLLKTYSDGKVFIDTGRIYALQDNEYIGTTIPLISAQTGLLDTPQRSDTYLKLTTLFEPNIVVGQAVDVYSQVQSVYNNQYKVYGVQHQGVISESESGQLSTTYQLFDGRKFSGNLKSVN